MGGVLVPSTSGHPNEERVGSWKIPVRVNGGPPKDLVLNVNRADRTLLETLSAEAQGNPNSFTANYRLGACREPV